MLYLSRDLDGRYCIWDALTAPTFDGEVKTFYTYGQGPLALDNPPKGIELEPGKCIRVNLVKEDQT